MDAVLSPSVPVCVMCNNGAGVSASLGGTALPGLQKMLTNASDAVTDHVRNAVGVSRTNLAIPLSQACACAHRPAHRVTVASAVGGGLCRGAGCDRVLCAHSTVRMHFGDRLGKKTPTVGVGARRRVWSTRRLCVTIVHCWLRRVQRCVSHSVVCGARAGTCPAMSRCGRLRGTVWVFAGEHN